jgi:hypothetical protein
VRSGNEQFLNIKKEECGERLAKMVMCSFLRKMTVNGRTYLRESKDIDVLFWISMASSHYLPSAID